MLNLYNHRGLIWNFVKRDISSKYVGSLLGLYWSVINPIITLAVYFVVFGLFLKARLPGNDNIWDFSLYLSAGILPWTAFSESVMRASGSIVNNKNYIKKVPFPSEIFPVYTILSEFVNLLIGLAIFMIWFWGTPIVYTVNVIPESMMWIVHLNPAYYMLEIYRDMLFYGRFPGLDKLLPFLLFSIIFLYISILIFRKTKRGFSELL
jgi:lipopolysaccharide transport system permease protein